MKDDDRNIVGRRSLLTNMGVAAVAGLTAATATGTTQAADHFSSTQPRSYSKDAWLDELTGEHRVFVDSSTVAGGGSAIRFASNIIVSHIDEYDGKSSDYAMVVCFRHASTPYGFDDALWAKYGELMNRDESISAPSSNLLNAPNAYSGQNTIPALVAKGAHFAICKRATSNMVRKIAAASGRSFDDVYAEVVAGAIPNAHFVAAGVLAVTRAQEHYYSLLYAE